MFQSPYHTLDDILQSRRMPADDPTSYVELPSFIGWTNEYPAADGPFPGWRGAAKRGFDILISGVALALLSPVFAMIAVLVKLDSAGEVLFRQTRIGFANQPFEVLKFRTMHQHVAEYDANCQATRRDQRVTRVGSWLRHLSLDELPQLLNVLRGDMSMVGPRPHAPGTCAAGRPFEMVAPRYAERHRVPPGITGLAQVRGWRGETDTEEKLLRRVESDLEYIARWSLWLDLVVLLRTAVAVLGMRNAY
jgi:polysaccharide biosynthesis protein PslA